MTCLSQSRQCRGELFGPNERSFATLHNSDFASASSYYKRPFVTSMRYPIFVRLQ